MQRKKKQICEKAFCLCFFSAKFLLTVVIDDTITHLNLVGRRHWHVAINITGLISLTYDL